MDRLDTTKLDPNGPKKRPSGEVPAAGETLGDYLILRPIGEGGMGSVYLGHRVADQGPVAIKVLADHLAANPAFVDRFYRESRSGSHLSHPNIVRSLGVGQDAASQKHFLVMEFVDGPSTHALLANHGRLKVGDAVHIVLDMARALEHAHSRNVVHRDIKPDNILITASGVAKLADMGLAKKTDEISNLTAARQGFGTPHYMPYEQAMNAKYVDGRSDIYALGATLYHLVTGATPFQGDSYLEVVEKKGVGEYPPARSLNPAVPESLERVLKKMLAREPEDRYQTASELIIDLERTGLASKVLSFADPELARKDPWALAQPGPEADPTRLDMSGSAKATPSGPGPGKPNARLWQLRYRGPDGRWKRARATDEQIRRLCREGRLPQGSEAARPGSDKYRPLRSYEELRAGLKLQPRTTPRPEQGQEDVPPPARRRRLWLALGTMTAVVLFALLVAWFFWSASHT